MEKRAREYAQELIEFLKTSGSPFMACKNLRKKFEMQGYQYLKEENQWNIQKNVGYVVCKENRNICSFFVGKKFNIHTSSIVIAVGHIDSPCLKITPNNNLTRNKINQVNVECYGGGLWNTWFDRGLGLSGQVVYKKNEELVEKILQINKSLFFLPSLAIHLQSINEYPIKVNNEKHLKPLISTKLFEQLHKEGGSSNKILMESEKRMDGNNSSMEINKCETSQGNMSTNGLEVAPSLLHILSKELNCKEEDITDFELCLMDSNPASLCGAYDEFIEGGRFDNLAGTFCIFTAFNELIKEQMHDDTCEDLYICIGYDHEEIGSRSEVGAQSYFTKQIVERIISSICKEEIKDTITLQEIYARIMAKSILLSVDMAHCTHPNYPDHYQPLHEVNFHNGIVIKYNSNKNYATSPFFVSLMKRTFELHEKKTNEHIKYQHFVVKNDMRCGSTVASMIAANMSIPGIDIGIPQLAMHSIRELMGILDIFYLVKGTFALFKYYSQVRSSCQIDS